MEYITKSGKICCDGTYLHVPCLKYILKVFMHLQLNVSFLWREFSDSHTYVALCTDHQPVLGCRKVLWSIYNGPVI